MNHAESLTEQAQVSHDSPRWVSIYSIMVVLFLASMPSITVRAEPGAVEPPRAGIPNLAQRLADLHPTDPVRYFELAEEIAYEMPGEEGANLARKLYILALELDRRAESPIGLERSVCLALADLATTDAQRGVLRLMAGEEPNAADPPSQAHGPEDDRCTEGVAELLAGESRRAAEAFRVPAAAARLDELAPRHPIISEWRDAADSKQPCPICRNRRVIPSSTDSRIGIPCTTCGGNPGPRLSARDYLATLAALAEITGAAQETWSADAAAHRHAPIPSLDSLNLSSQFNVDPASACWQPGETPDWRTGTWVECAKPKANSAP